MISHCLASMTKVSFVHLRAVGRVLSHIRSRPRPPMFGPSYQGMATSVNVVALDLSLLHPLHPVQSEGPWTLDLSLLDHPHLIDPPLQIIPP
ncbi:hypothetical protein V8C43DRAFT_293058 [Trichoderma afarasin]